MAFGGRDANSGEKDWNSVQFGKEQQDNRNRVFLFKYFSFISNLSVSYGREFRSL